MKNKFMQTIAGTILALLMIFGAAQLYVSGQEKENNSDPKTSENSRHSLVGAWETVVTPRNCQTGVPVMPDFQGLITFNEGGTVAETASGSSPALRSPGHGVWRRENGARTYSMKVIFLRFSPTGAFIGKQRIAQTLEVSADGSQSTSTGTVEVLDLNGNVLGGGCSTATATRIE
ncbi:MAG TPA: hypothetical protein VNB22_22045 [Pyrinomonadaceae bacterium]|jgi:hypothetical protein|nr:hypothetical protein [Pyrinomonadaceae bacterium]